ncbi:MAG: hypothetical protein AABY22_19835 [Nanoarchaeota archaeon]
MASSIDHTFKKGYLPRLTEFFLESVVGSDGFKKTGRVLDSDGTEVSNSRITFVGVGRVKYELFPTPPDILKKREFIRRQEITGVASQDANAYASSRKQTFLGKVGLYCQERLLFYHIEI